MDGADRYMHLLYIVTAVNVRLAITVAATMKPMKPKKMATQRQKFIEAARKAGVDESEAAFEAKLKKIAKAKPTPSKATPSK